MCVHINLQVIFRQVQSSLNVPILYINLMYYLRMFYVSLLDNCSMYMFFFPTCIIGYCSASKLQDVDLWNEPLHGVLRTASLKWRMAWWPAEGLTRHDRSGQLARRFEGYLRGPLRPQHWGWGVLRSVVSAMLRGGDLFHEDTMQCDSWDLCYNSHSLFFFVNYKLIDR